MTGADAGVDQPDDRTIIRWAGDIVGQHADVLKRDQLVPLERGGGNRVEHADLVELCDAVRHVAVALYAGEKHRGTHADVEVDPLAVERLDTVADFGEPILANAGVGVKPDLDVEFVDLVGRGVELSREPGRRSGHRA
jgi:hypothetical protein